jgi:uncharacterized coiled-coil protein SlyX
MTTLPLRKSIDPATTGRAFLLIPLALTYFALSPMARAVNPPPDGGYPNGNTAEGDGALQNLTTGVHNTAIGNSTLLNNTSGGENTAVGFQALLNNTDGLANTAMGYVALFGNTSGTSNTAIGAVALAYNTSGNYNTAIGLYALELNTIGSFNTATGSNALEGNTAGSSNTAIGVGALRFNKTGNNNTANGNSALQNNTMGNGNTANGVNALKQNTTGSKNTANGVNALVSNKTGSGNTAEGDGALLSNAGSFNVAVGFNAGSNLTTGSNNIDIGHAGVAGESNTMRIGTVKQTATFITGIRGAATANANAVPVVIDSAGQLGTVSSSRRFKDEIKSMENSSEAILGLKPVTFHYKTDKQNTPQFGLIAEEVAKVDPNLVVRDEKGEIYTVRYEAVNAMLLNEFLKEHRKVEEQQSTIAELKLAMAQQKAANAQQQKQIAALTATVQKVSDQISLSKPSPQFVANP